MKFSSILDFLVGTKMVSSSESREPMIYRPQNETAPQWELRAGRATIAIGIMLSLLHFIGIIISLYVMILRLLDLEMPEKPFYNVCTSSILCPVYYITRGLTGVSVQLVGSVCGLSVNLLLLSGICFSIPWCLFLWLFTYSIAILGCLLLFGIMINVLVARDSQEINQ